MLISLTCPLGTGCDSGTDKLAYKTKALEFNLAKTLMEMHMTHAHSSGAPQTAAQPRTEN